MFIFFSLIFLFFKSSRSIFLLLSLEFLVLGSIFYLATFNLGFFILFLMFLGVMSSIFGMILFVSLVKSYGKDLSFLVF